MSDVKRYYFLKLKENFFQDETILLLEDGKDGFLYTNILLKMYLLSLKHEGQLLLSDGIAYTPPMIATLTHHQIGTVEKALLIFTQLGLVEELQDGSLYMSNIQSMIGSTSTEAERKRRERLRLNQQRLLSEGHGQNSDIRGQTADICPKTPAKRPPEYRDKRIDIRDESLELRDQIPPRTFGRYANVRLTDDELAMLQRDHPTDWQELIERLSGYMASTGKRYLNHMATMEQWAQRDMQKNTPIARLRDYSVEDGETV